MTERKHPHPLVAIIPVVVLIILISIVITLFGSDALSGGSQIALLMGVAVCVLISMTCYHIPWKTFERQMTKTIGDVSVTLLILLTVGMLAGSWMISGVVPTLIYSVTQFLSGERLCHLCLNIAAVRQFLDNDCHHWCSPVGYRSSIGHLRSMDSRCHHLGSLFR